MLPMHGRSWCSSVFIGVPIALTFNLVDDLDLVIRRFFYYLVFADLNRYRLYCSANSGAMHVDQGRAFLFRNWLRLAWVVVARQTIKSNHSNPWIRIFVNRLRSLNVWFEETRLVRNSEWVNFTRWHNESSTYGPGTSMRPEFCGLVPLINWQMLQLLPISIAFSISLCFPMHHWSRSLPELLISWPLRRLRVSRYVASGETDLRGFSRTNDAWRLTSTVGLRSD